MPAQTRQLDTNPLGDGVVLSSPLGHRLMFLALSTISFLLFAPAVILPILREHGELLAEEARLKQRVVELQDEVRHRAELEDAFLHDAVVNERLAVLDLGYRRPNEEIVTVLAEEPFAPERAPSIPAATGGPLMISNDWPGWIHRGIVWADERGLVELFLDPDLRPVLLLMSAGGLISAFALFAPKANAEVGHGAAWELSTAAVSR